MLSGYSGERLLLTLWVGSLWAIGYLAVPMAFANMDVQLAGDYAGKLFYAVNILGIVSAAILLISRLFVYGFKGFHRFWRSWMILLMMLVSLVFVLFIQPEMQALKMMGLQQQAVVDEFNKLHGLSESLYLLVSLFGLMLVLTTDRQSEAENEG
jgi:hypothetical protein